MDLLTAPFRYEFMQTALIAGILVALICAPLGVYVVLRRMAFIGDALAHTVLPGLVVAYLNGWNLLGGALIAAVATALGIGWFSRRQALHEDTAIGILFTGMFALGILFISTVRSFKDFTHILFGYILGVTTEQILLMSAITVIVLATLVALRKEFELTSFDPLYAEAIGLKADRLRYVLLVLMALAVVAAIQAVGVVLTSALLVVPAAAATMLTNRLPRMMVVAVGVAVIAAFTGLLLSFYFDVASGALIVLVCIALFLVAWFTRLVRDRLRAAHQRTQGVSP